MSADAVNHWVKMYREGGMAALIPENRNAAQNGKPACVPFGRSVDADGDDMERGPQGRQLELENALMGGGGRRKKTPAPT